MAVPSSVRTLRDIAANISALAEEISDHLEAAHRPPLSFSPDGDQELPTSLAQPRASLLSLGSELLDLVTGPEEMIVMGIGYVSQKRTAQQLSRPARMPDIFS